MTERLDHHWPKADTSSPSSMGWPPHNGLGRIAGSKSAQTLGPRSGSASAASLSPKQRFAYKGEARNSGIYTERFWRHPEQVEQSRSLASEILVARWTEIGTTYRRCESERLPDRHVVSIALKAARLSLRRGAQVIFDGTMPLGTIQITEPSQAYSIEFLSPCDFLHFYVSNDFIEKCTGALKWDGPQPECGRSDLMFRDPLAEALSRTLIEGGRIGDHLYTDIVARALVVRAVRLLNSRVHAGALPKWRLRRVKQYVDDHIEEALSLAELAAASGLSAMYFAAQFRAATGLRPHEYVVSQRIERAKAMLSGDKIPIAEVAFSVGFKAQAHFTTVFKRWTGETPGRWRRTFMSPNPGPD
jgi:AraC family transcriptional regulator